MPDEELEGEVDVLPSEDNLEPEANYDDEVTLDDEPSDVFHYDEDSVNLVAEFESHPDGVEALKKLVSECDDEVQASWEKNAEYREQQARNWDTIYCRVPPKSAPFENCANVAMPIALENITKLSNRIFSEIFGDWSSVFTFTPASPAAVEVAKIVEQHSNWQIRNKITGFKREHHRGVMMFIAGGDVVCHSYYDPTTKQNCHKMLTCDDFVTPYTHVSMADDFSDIPWYARRIPFHKHKLRSMKGLWENVEEVISQDPPDEDGHVLETELRDTVRDKHGEEPDNQGKGEYEIIHYEGWLMLPNQTSERFCQLIFDIGTKKALKLSIHERASYEERARFKMQTAEKEQYLAVLQQQEEMLGYQQQAEDDIREVLAVLPQSSSEIGTYVEQLEAVKNQPMPPPPEKPTWMRSDRTEPEAEQKTPVYMFSHAVCLEPTTGNLGIGVGMIATQLNVGANIVMNQFIDSATLGNGKTIITAGSFNMDKLKVGPGVVNKVKNVMASDLKNSIHELSFGAANPQLIQAFQMMSSGAEDAGHTSSLMSGGTGKSGETARGLQGRVEQMNIMVGVPAQKYADFVVQIMRNNCKLNATYMNETEIFFTNQMTAQGMFRPEQVKVLREMYDNPYELELQSDIQFKGRSQRISEADEIVQMPNAVPMLQPNLAFQYGAVKGALLARGLHEMVAMLGPPPEEQVAPMAPPPPEPEGGKGGK